MQASKTEKDKEGLNETYILVICVIAYAVGGLVGIALFTLFVMGKIRRSVSGEFPAKLGGSLCLGI